MEIDSLKARVPAAIYESLKQRGITKLTPPQAMAIEKGLLQGANIVVASPTASGKTLVAELACAMAILSKGKKAIYIAPMRALASEKFTDFKNDYPYIKSVLSIGDLDSEDKWLSGFQMMFFSTEKFDSLIRHGVDWLREVGCFVFDEVHMIGDISRGPTMELLITKLKHSTEAQTIALSATIGNAKELSEWMEAELVESDYRPVKLDKGIIHDGVFHYYEDGKEIKQHLMGESEIPEIRVVEDTLSRKKQALIFYSTRRSAEFGAVKIAKDVHKLLTEPEKAELKELGKKVSSVLDRPTEQCVKLGSLIEKGIAFHHAGLLSQQKTAVENAFKENKIKVICSTTTLGYGINMPAHTVLVRDITRFDGNYSEQIGINEVLQLFGRAGRPKYDTEGRAMLPSSTKYKIPDLKKKYITADPESINSSLGIAPVLRSHVLAFVSERFLNTAHSIATFMEGSLYGKQFGNKAYMEMVIGKILDDLERWEFVERMGDLYKATRLGERISELYIDPLSARLMLDAMKKVETGFDILLMLCNTLEMKPHVRAIKEAEERYSAYIAGGNEVPFYSYGDMNYADYDPVKVFSTAMFLEDWTNEVREAEIVKKYGSTPGALYTKLTNADWIIYSASELAGIIGIPKANIVKARVRLRYGIKEELLDLVRLEQVGRARARMLFNNGIKKAQEIPKNKEKVISLLGKEVAQKLFDQLE
jgi:helicase